MSERTPVLILGLGNVLCGDDGVGVAAVVELCRRYQLPEGVSAVDGGTLGLSLLPVIDSARQVILIDAVAADAPAGTLVRLEGDEVGPAVYERLSPHQIGVSDLLSGASLLGRYPERVILWGIVPATTDLALGRTPAVEAQLGALVDAVVTELAELGFAPVLRKDTTSGELAGGDDHVARALGL